jgi:hypothetical protein
MNSKYQCVVLGHNTHFEFSDSNSFILNRDTYDRQFHHLQAKYNFADKLVHLTNLPLNTGDLRKNNLIKIQVLLKPQGALCTLGLSLSELDEFLPILVVPFNSQSSYSVETFLTNMSEQNFDAGIIGFNSTERLYSYVRQRKGEILEVAEKEVIGSFATAGIFYFRNRQTLIDCINWSLMNRVTRNGLYYVAPALNSIITSGGKIGLFEISEKDYARINLDGMQQKGHHGDL